MQTQLSQYDGLLQEQLQREEKQRTRSMEAVASSQRRLKELGRESALPHGQALFKATGEALSDALKLLFEEAVIDPTRARVHGAAYPFFDEFDSVDQVAAVALTAAIDLLTRRHRRPTFSQHIGAAIELEARLIRLRGRAPLAQRKLFRTGMSRKAIASKYVLQALNCPCPEWDNRSRLLVGEFLLSTIVESTGLFVVGKRKVGRHLAYMVWPSEWALEFVKRTKPRRNTASYGAMVVPPRPWVGCRGGGLLSGGSPLVHVHLHQMDWADRVIDRLYEPADMKTVIDAVNHLQTVPLRVSSEMTEIVRIAWDGGIDGLFQCSKVPLEVPERLASDPDPEALKVRNNMAAKAHRDREKFRCARVKIERTVQAAEELAGKEIYQAAHIDYRGRIYASNRTVTHQGPDGEKSLLSFRPEPINEEGIEWLLKAAAGHWGMSRAKWEDRLQWGLDNRERLLAAATDPLGRLELWRSAKDPWQFLQLCQGYREAVETGATGVPIRLDQTTSGLGILSALLRHEGIGRLCNVWGNSPKDLYAVVAERVTAALKQDQQFGDERGKFMSQLWLEIGVDRSLVKGPVLAAPYGGGYNGLSDMVVDFLDDHYGFVGVEQFMKKVAGPSRYLASVIWREMKVVIDPAMVISKWLKACVKVSFTEGMPLKWTTPSGLPMEVADQMVKERRVNTLLFGSKGTVVIAAAEEDGKLNPKAASKNISANTTHAFDAAFAAMICSSMGQLSAPVLANHDCFATTPARAGQLHNLLLTTFRGLYQTDWLAVMHEEMQFNTGLKLPKPPERGTLRQGLIGENPYVFS